MELRVTHQPSGGKEWVAEVTGTDAERGLARRFLRPVAREWSGSGRTGHTLFDVEEGRLYEANVPWRGRRYYAVREGEIVSLTASEFRAEVVRRENVPQ